MGGVHTINVLGLVGGNVTSSKLAVRSLCGAVTAREIVYDESSKLVARNVLKIVLND